MQCVLQAQHEPQRVSVVFMLEYRSQLLRNRFLIQFTLRVINLLACSLEEQLASVQLHHLLTPLWAVEQQLEELSCHRFSVVTVVPFCHVQVVVHTCI